MFPICLSVCMLSRLAPWIRPAVHAAVVVIWVSFMLYQAVFFVYLLYGARISLARAVGITVVFVLIAAGFSWLIGNIRDELHALGSLDATRVKRLCLRSWESSSLGGRRCTQGIGRGDVPRIVGTGTFSSH